MTSCPASPRTIGVHENRSTLCYPRLSVEDRGFIDAFRRKHEVAHCDVVAPHLTLAFSTIDAPEPVYRQRVGAIARSQEVLPLSSRK